MVFNCTTYLTGERGVQSRLSEKEVIPDVTKYSAAGQTRISGVTRLVRKAKKQTIELTT